jgi:very-short-patch-repair endonuclease
MSFSGRMDERIGLLRDIARGQHGALTIDQIEQAGLTADQRRGLVERGTLERVGARVLRSPFVEATPLADLAAFVLDCGEGALASGSTAAALHRFDGFGLAPPWNVTMPRGRLVRRRGHHIHTTIDLAPIDRTRVDGIPAMTTARTLIDIARSLSPRRLTVALDSALRDRKITEDLLHQRIVELRGSGRHGIPTLLAVIDGVEAARGGHSWLERRFLQLCAGSALPRPQTQQVTGRAKDKLVRVDCCFPGTTLVVELLGYRWHRGSRTQFNRDAERVNALVLQGYVVLQFTYDHVVAEPDWVVAQVRSALQPFV